MSVTNDDVDVWVETLDNAKAGRLQTVRLPDGGKLCAIVDLKGVPIKYQIVFQLKPGQARALGEPFATKITIDGGMSGYFRCTNPTQCFSSIRGRYLGFAPVKTSETGSGRDDDLLLNIGKIEIELFRCVDTTDFVFVKRGPALVGDTALAPEGKKMFRATTISMGDADLSKPCRRVEYTERVFSFEINYASRMALELQGILPMPLPHAAARGSTPRLEKRHAAPSRTNRQQDAGRSNGSDGKPLREARARAVASRRHASGARPPSSTRPSSSPEYIDLTDEGDELAGHAMRHETKRPKIEVLN